MINARIFPVYNLYIGEYTHKKQNLSNCKSTFVLINERTPVEKVEKRRVCMVITFAIITLPCNCSNDLISLSRLSPPFRSGGRRRAGGGDGSSFPSSPLPTCPLRSCFLFDAGRILRRPDARFTRIGFSFTKFNSVSFLARARAYVEIIIDDVRIYLAHCVCIRTISFALSTIL